jgi:hypothetical protein
MPLLHNLPNSCHRHIDCSAPNPNHFPQRQPQPVSIACTSPKPSTNFFSARPSRPLAVHPTPSPSHTRLCTNVQSREQLVAVMAAATASDRVLVSTHLSDVYSPLQTAAITISTSKPYVPFPPQASDNEPPPEHAQHASFFHSVQIGVILLRLIHNGHIVELVSLSMETPPIRFVFPYTVLPSPAVGNPRAAHSCSNSEWFPLSPRLYGLVTHHRRCQPSPANRHWPRMDPLS